MNFYVFLAPPNNCATIHKGQCSHCNEGKGQNRPEPKQNVATEWLGPYGTREEAFAVAQQSGLRAIIPCGHCKP